MHDLEGAEDTYGSVIQLDIIMSYASRVRRDGRLLQKENNISSVQQEKAGYRKFEGEAARHLLL